VIDLLQIIPGLHWWSRLLRRSPGRAVVVLIAELIAGIVLLVTLPRLTYPFLDVLVVVVVALVIAAICLWANLTATGPCREVPKGPNEWAPPSAEEFNRVIGGSGADDATE
jgi:hypothetical protein